MRARHTNSQPPLKRTRVSSMKCAFRDGKLLHPLQEVTTEPFTAVTRGDPKGIDVGPPPEQGTLNTPEEITADARSKSSPLSRPFQPICPTVRTSWPFNSGTRSLGICSSSRTRNGYQGLTGLLQRSLCLLASDGRKLIEKPIQ
jgi:hypothetical protein